MNRDISKVFIVILLTTLWAAIQPVLAHEWTPEEAAKALPKQELRYIKFNPDKFIKRTIKRLFTYGADGVATPERVEIAEKVFFATLRAKKLRQFLIRDLDGDGQVTTEELNLAISMINSAQQAKAVLFQNMADTNSNGVVTFAEATGHIERGLAQNPRLAAKAWDIMILDRNGDEAVDAAEATVAIKEIAKLIAGETTDTRTD